MKNLRKPIASCSILFSDIVGKECAVATETVVGYTNSYNISIQSI